MSKRSGLATSPSRQASGRARSRRARSGEPQLDQEAEPFLDVGLRDFLHLRRQHQELRRDFSELRREFDALVHGLRGDGFGDGRGQDPKGSLESTSTRRLVVRTSLTFMNLLENSELDLPGRLFQLCGKEDSIAVAWRRVKEVCRNGKQRIEPMMGEKLYVFGGLVALPVQGTGIAERCGCEAFTDGTCTWTPLPKMRFSRSDSSAGVFQGRIYVCGGYEPFGKVVERYNPLQGAWDKNGVALLCKFRACSAAACCHGRLYVCGGADRDGAAHNTVEYLDPKLGDGKGLWVIEGPEMRTGRRHLGVASLGSGEGEQLIVSGGVATPLPKDVFRPEDGVLATVEALGPAGNWVSLPNLAEQRGWHAMASLQGSVYVCGGYGNGRVGRTSVERFDAEAGVWTSVASMLMARLLCRAVTMSGCLYVLGGWGQHSPGSSGLASWERFNPDKGCWELAGNMLDGHGAFAAVVARVGPAVTELH